MRSNQSTRIVLFFWLLAPGSWLLLTTPSFAQPSSIYGKDTTQVYVRDSAIAVEKFALAERMERLREWGKAGDVYQEVLTSYADRVVPSKVDPNDNHITQYTSVVPAVQERLARWPNEGLDTYRQHYGVEAQALLDSAKPGDLATLHKVYTNYFITDAGKRAGVRLIDAYFESGEFPAAAWIADRLLALHPELRAGAENNVERPRLLYRAALAHHFAGSDAPAVQQLDELKKNFTDALGKVRGQDVRLAESLESELKTPRPTPVVASARNAPAHSGAGDSWPMTFGSPDRSRVAPAVSSVGANLFSIELVRDTNVNRAVQVQYEPQVDQARKTGLMTGIYPAVDRGELFFQDNARVYAVSLESGLALPGWAQTYDGDRGGRYVAAGCIPMPRNQHCAVSLTDDSVLAVMGQTDLLAMTIGNYGAHETRLVCLDRTTGKERWVARPRQLSDDPSTAALRDLDLSGSPLVVGDNVYVIARGGKGLQFEDCYVLCLDVDSGKFRWACYVASANVGSGLFDMEITGSSGQSISHLAYAAGRLYCSSNLGAVAAINSYDGTIVWLNLYDDRISPNGDLLTRRRWQPQPTLPEKPWTYNPVIVSDGKVFVLPSDAQGVHIYDAGSGEEVKRIPTKVRIQELSRQQPYPGSDADDIMKTLVGVLGKRLVLCGDRSVVCLDWTTFDPKKPRESLFWTSKIDVGGKIGDPSPAGTGDKQTFGGRPFLSADAVFVPALWKLQAIQLRNGKTTFNYPATGSWSDGEGPGNVLATGDNVIIAGPTRVTVYTDMNVALRKLDAAVAAAPNDPNPRLRYAEVMFVSGKLDAAVTKLDEAIDLLGGRNAMTAGASRDRLFADALTFAQKLAKDGRGGAGAASAQVIASLFDRAADAALAPAQHVNYRLSRADNARANNDPQLEMKLLNEILTQPQWRNVTVARGENAGARQAGLVASSAIDDLLRRPDGKTLYEPYARRADEMLDAARPAADPQQLMEVAQSFPNAPAARRAMLLAAESYEAAGNPRLAVQALRQLYFRNPDTPDRAQIMEAMARNYLAMPNRLDVAAARLAQGAKLAPTMRLSRPIHMSDGQALQDMTLAEALDLVRKMQSRATSRSLPDLKLPAVANASRPPAPFAPQTDASTIVGVSTLLIPSRDFARMDRVVAYAPDAGISVYAVGSNRPLFTSATITGAAPPRGVAWVGGNLLAWSDAKLVMLDGEGGQVVWEVSPTALPPVEVVAGTGGGDSQADAGAGADANGGADDVANFNNVQVRQLGGGEAIIIQERGGLVQQRVLIRAGGRAVQGRFVIRNGNGVLIAGNGQPVDPNGGNPGDALAPDAIVGVQPLADRVLFATNNGRVVAVDLRDGKLLWQARPSKGSIDKLLGSDDFIVARVLDGMNSSQLVALDASTGALVYRKTFPREAAGGLVLPVNVELAGDGTLVWLTPWGVVGKDLFESGDMPRFGGGPIPPREGGGTVVEAAFANTTGDDQFVIADGRILAVATSGGKTGVRVMSLETGQMLKGEDGTTPMELATEAPLGGRVSIRVVGSMLYMVSPGLVKACDLNAPEREWRSDKNLLLADERPTQTASVREAVIARDQVVMIAETRPEASRPGRAGRAARQPAGDVKTSRLFIYSRGPRPKGGEKGTLQYDPVDVAEPTGVLAWQAVDGGLYYLAGDTTLHFLKGTDAR